MNVSWDSVNASDVFFEDLRQKLMDKVEGLKRQNDWARLLALPVGLASFALGATKAVCHVAEAFFKGLVNLFAWPLSQEFECKRAFIFMGGETLFGAVGLIEAYVGAHFDFLLTAFRSAA